MEVKNNSIKLMKIEIVDRFFDNPQYNNVATSEKRGMVRKGEFSNIELDEPIGEPEFEKALDTIYTFLVNREINNVEVNLKFRDMSLRPKRLMTIDEISEELNADVTVVGHKDEPSCPRVADEFPDLCQPSAVEENNE